MLTPPDSTARSMVMPVSTGMPDLERALHLLIHDLRAPLSVAHGYLRLVREHRLPNEAEADRALAQAAESLGRMSRMCDDALAYAALKQASAVLTTVVPVREFTSRLGAVLDPALTIDGTDALPDAQVRLAAPDRIVDALGAIASAVWHRCRRLPDVALHVVATSAELQLLVGHRAEWKTLADQPRAAFDPWRGGHGLGLPYACAVLAQAAGDVWGFEGTPAAGISLPLETAS